METIQQLMQASLGVGVGITLGVALGLGFRKRAGKTGGLIADSVFVTAAVCGALAMAAMMFIKWIGG